MSTTVQPRIALSDLGPIAQLRAGRLGRRLVQLYAGLLLYGFSIALMVRSDLGLAPWDVLHSGLTRWFPIDIGQALVLVSFVVMLAWIPLREMPGVGTISNAIVIGLSTDVFLALLAAPGTLWLRVVLLLSGVVLQGAATAAYIGAELGRGPRDGLMTGLARRTGRSLRLVRTLMELSVVALGLLLGGVAGGIFPDVPAAVDRCVRVRTTVEPDPAWQAAYEGTYARFRALYPALDTVKEQTS